MATFRISPNLDNYRRSIGQLGAAVLGICKYASYDAADMVITEIKKNCPVGEDDRNNAHLRDAFKLSKYQNKDGFIYTKVCCVGYDDKGSPQALKARSLESCVSGRIDSKYAFIRKSVEAVRNQAIASMEKNLNEKINEIVNK